MRFIILRKSVGRRIFLSIIFGLQMLGSSTFAAKKAPPVLDFWTKLAKKEEELDKKTQTIQAAQLKIERKLFFFDRTINKSLLAQERHGLFLSEKGRANLIVQVAEIKNWCTNSISELMTLIKDFDPELDQTMELIKEIEPILVEKNNAQELNGKKSQNFDNNQTLKDLSTELSLLLDQRKSLDLQNQLNEQKTILESQILDEQRIITLLLRRKAINQNSSFIKEKIKQASEKLKSLQKDKDLIISQIKDLNLPETITKDEINLQILLVHEKIEKFQKDEPQSIIDLTKNTEEAKKLTLEEEKQKKLKKVFQTIEAAKTAKSKTEETIVCLKKTTENCENLYKLINL